MKKKFRKVVAVILTMAMTMSVGMPAFADEQTETFPIMANPGSKIICEIDGSLEYQPYIFLNSTVALVDEKILHNELIPLEEEEKLVAEIEMMSKQYPIYYFDEIQIPNINSGMVASYDGMGYLNKIIDANGDIVPLTNNCIKIAYPENFSIETNSIVKSNYYDELGTFIWGKDNNTLTRTEESVLATGWVTWFDDEIGNHDNILTENDCATAMSYDRPPSNTAIHVRNLENNIDAYVYKNDVGSLPNAVLDIRPEKMENTFNVAVGTNSGKFNGRYFYYR